MPARRVLVVGGGISGLAAAWELTGGADRRPDAPEVVVLEASPRLGGPLRSDDFGGRAVDMGPDGFLGRRPEAVDLCHELGVADALVPIAARGASVWARGRLRALPEGLALGIPTRFWPAARSGVLGLRGQLGLARDTLLPRPDARGPIGDRSIGPLVARKLGQRVVDRLVDPLIGGIHAGTVDDMSAAAVFPPLLAAAQRRGGLMRALRAEVPAADPEGPPLFWTLEGGMATLVDALAARLAERGVDIRVSAEADRLERVDGGWAVWSGGAASPADAVVLATPAPATAALLVAPRRRGGGPARDDRVRLGRPRDVPRCGRRGPLAPARHRVPRAPQQPAPGRGRGHAGGDGVHVPRPQVAAPRPRRGGAVARLPRSHRRRAPRRVERRRGGRQGLGRTGRDHGCHRPAERRHRRALPRALPQYRVHHLLRTAGVEAAVARLGGVAVAGAAYHGVGIPACIASGRAAAHALL